MNWKEQKQFHGVQSFAGKGKEITDVFCPHCKNSWKLGRAKKLCPHCGEIFLTVKELVARGYRRISNAHKILSRIDRPDWKEAMAATHLSGMAWVEALSKQPGQAEDYYRRCISKDWVTIKDAKRVPPSNWDRVGFVPFPGCDQ